MCDQNHLERRSSSLSKVFREVLFDIEDMPTKANNV
jgi:hypothetical protein